MEILQTIWNVLITQNAELTSLIMCPLMFVESYLYMIIFITLLKIPSNKQQKITYVLLYSIISLFNVFVIPSPYYTFINLFVFFILVMTIFKTTALKSILSIVIVYTMTFLLGTPLILVCVYLLKIPSSLIETVPLYKILYCIIFYCFIFFFYLIANKGIKQINTHKIKKLNLLQLNFILGTISIAIQCFIEFKYIDYIPLYLIVLNIFILLLYFFISLYSMYRTSSLEATTQNLEQEKIYNQTLLVFYDKIRQFKHDFNNTVQGIGGYIATNNMEGLKKYYNDVLDDCQRINNLAILSPEVINNPAIYSLLTAKYHEATELGIKVTLDIFMDLSTISMKIYDLTRILGILIDNAIDAAKQCEQKEIIINFRKDNRRNKQLFIIENTYSNKDVNIDEIFEKGKSSKKTDDPKSHGLGLWEVRQLIKKNRNLDLYTTKTDRYFKQQFEIYC